MNITIDFNKNIGKLKAVNGVSNGPICHGTDLSRYFQEANITSVRYHDTDGSGPYGRYMIDISRVFPNFEADEYDENNYHFIHTDSLIKSAIDCGAEIIYRLGESIDHSIMQKYARPPKDFDKWCRICVQVIKHYNDGWANGFYYGLKYWEIWNEPEGHSANGIQPMWCGGTFEQALDLYKRAVLALKAYDETLLVGGMSFMYCNHWLKELIEYCQTNSLPLDFLSFHHYCQDLNWIVEQANDARAWLDDSGYKNTEIIIAEWTVLFLNDEYTGIYWDFIGDPINNVEKCKILYTNQRNEIGASFVAGFLIRMNDLPIDKGIFYDFDPISNWCGLFDHFFGPTKTYYSFKNYGIMLKNSLYRAAANADEGYVIASKSLNIAECIFSNFRGNNSVAKFTCKGMSSYKKATIYLIDQRHTEEKTLEFDINDDSVCFEVPCSKNATLHLICE